MKHFIANLLLKFIPYPLARWKLVRYGRIIKSHVIVFNVHIFTIVEPRFNRYIGA